MPRRKQQAPRRSAGNARGPRRGERGPGGAGAGGRGSRGGGPRAAAALPPAAAGGPSWGGRPGPPGRPRPGAAGSVRVPPPGPARGAEKLRGASRRWEKRGRAERPGEAGAAGRPVLPATSGGGVRWGKKLLLRGLSALEKSSKGGRLNLTLENKVTSLGREECGRRVSLENSSL